MALLSLREMCEQQESEYLQLQRMDAYINGTQDQYRDDAECVRENLYDNNQSKKHSSCRVTTLDDCYPNGNSCAIKHFEDNPLFRDEFNRKFNRIIAYHNTLWRDTPFYERDRTHYSYRYYKFFEDLMFLLEQYPDACSNDDYNAVVRARFFYRKQYYSFTPSNDQWRKWPKDISKKRRPD